MKSRTVTALFAGIASLAAGCATERAARGELRATALIQPDRALEFSRVRLRVQEGRVLGEGLAGQEFEAALGAGGCVLATSRGRLVRYCPAGAEGSARLYRSIDATGTRLFTVAQDGRGLVIESAGDRAVVTLPADAVGGELRRHPELMGTAFAERFLPSDGRVAPRPIALLLASPLVDPRAQLRSAEH